MDLLEAFQHYLAATFLLSLLQAAAQARLYRAILAAPTRWPSLSRLLIRHTPASLSAPVLALAGLTFGLWLGWTLLRAAHRPDAHLTIPQLLDEPGAAATALLGALVMLGLDVHALLRFRRRIGRGTERLLGLTEWLVRHDPSGALHRVASWRIRWWLVAQAPVARRWLFLRLAEAASRLTMGTILWMNARPGG